MSETARRHLLIVDDDVGLLREATQYFERQGYEVATAEDGPAAIKIASSSELDLVLLDLNFPPKKGAPARMIDGIEVLRILRESGEVPILVLSSTNISAMKVMALTLGADDYISKPFEYGELGARVDAVLRRSGGDARGDRVLTFQRLRLDPGERRAWKDDVVVELTGIEFDILYTLARRPQHVFTREKIIELAWRSESYCIPKAVDVHIGHIRKKLEDDPAQPRLIQTVRGTGYRFEDTEK